MILCHYTFQACSTLSALTEVSSPAKYCNNHKVAEPRLFEKQTIKSVGFLSHSK